MLRGFVILCVAALTLGAAPQPSAKNANVNKPRAAEITPTSPPPRQQPVESPLYKEPCGDSAQDRQSDLCAQWQAADAARDAAFWTMVGVIVAFVGTGGLLGQIWLTRKALDVAMADRRPSIHADLVGYKLEGGTVKAEIGIKNYGQSEADKVAFTAAVAVGPYPLLSSPPPLKSKSKPSGKLYPGRSRWQYVEKDVGKYAAQIAAEKASLIITGHVTYVDQFGRKYADRFDYFCTGADFESANLRVCDPWEKPEDMDTLLDESPELDLKGGK